MKNKTLMILIVTFLLLFATSVVYNIFFLDKVENHLLLFDEHGEVIKEPAYTPAAVFPFGTDRGGNNIALRLIEGFQYTFSIIILVTLLRMIMGGILSYMLVFILGKASKWIQYSFIPYLYLPAFIMVFLLSDNLYLLESAFSFWELIIFQCFILIIIGIPVITNTLTNEMNQVLKNEFIQPARTLGGSKWHIFTKHVLPVLKSRLILITLQQITISFLLLLHLGAFSYYIGGSQKHEVNEEGRRLSMSAEWGGMIGESRNDLLTAPWVYLIPLFVATSLLIFINMTIRKMEQSD